MRFLPFLSVTAALLLVTHACNDGPDGIVVVSFPPTSTAIRQVYSYQLVATNETGTIVYSVATGPTGLTVDASGLVQWTTTYADLGTHPVVITVQDDQKSLTQAWDVRVHQGADLGVTLSPRGHVQNTQAQDWTDHYTGHAPWGAVIAFHGNWRDTIPGAGSVPLLAATGIQAAQTYGFTPVIGFGWSDGDGNPDLTSQSSAVDNSWSNQETRFEFRSMVTTFASQYQPPYVFLGNETNSYYVTHTQQEWDDWISQFEECYDAIKGVSPNTVVYTTFQLEKMKGMGINNGWAYTPHWNLIDDHTQNGKIDAIGFTSYPHFEFSSPSTIPSGYYDEITQHWTGPVVFSEIGWLAAANPPYPGGEQQQVDFITLFFDLTQDLELANVVWLFLHDLDAGTVQPAFDQIGFRNNLGDTTRLGDATWQGEVTLRQK